MPKTIPAPFLSYHSFTFFVFTLTYIVVKQQEDVKAFSCAPKNESFAFEHSRPQCTQLETWWWHKMWLRRLHSTHHLNDFGEVFVEVGDFEWMFVGLWWGIFDVRCVYLRKKQRRIELKFQISQPVEQIKVIHRAWNFNEVDPFDPTVSWFTRKKATRNRLNFHSICEIVFKVNRLLRGLSDEITFNKITESLNVKWLPVDAVKQLTQILSCFSTSALFQFTIMNIVRRKNRCGRCKNRSRSSGITRENLCQKSIELIQHK